jgi:hypothetical protein
LLKADKNNCRIAASLIGSFYLHDLVNIIKHNYSFRYESTADVPSVKTTRYGLKSFRYFSTKQWNF